MEYNVCLKCKSGMQFGKLKSTIRRRKGVREKSRNMRRRRRRRGIRKL